MNWSSDVLYVHRYWLYWQMGKALLCHYVKTAPTAISNLCINFLFFLCCVSFSVPSFTWAKNWIFFSIAAMERNGFVQSSPSSLMVKIVWGSFPVEENINFPSIHRSNIHTALSALLCAFLCWIDPSKRTKPTHSSFPSDCPFQFSALPRSHFCKKGKQLRSFCLLLSFFHLCSFLQRLKNVSSIVKW